jgi:hypothetical protein
MSVESSSLMTLAGGDEFEEHGHTLSAMQGRGLRRELGRGLHSPTSQLNLSRFGHTSLCPAV